MTEGNWKWDYDKNIFYHPEAVGAEMIGTLDEADLSYEYNTYIVVREKATGKVYADDDSGCSCPTPFEQVGGFGDMREIRTVEDFRNDVRAWRDKIAGWSDSDEETERRRPKMTDVRALEMKVEAALKAGTGA